MYEGSARDKIRIHQGANFHFLFAYVIFFLYLCALLLCKGFEMVYMKNEMFNSPPHWAKCSICSVVYMHAPSKCVHVLSSF